MQTYSKTNTSQLVKIGLFFAIVLIQTWVPFLGNINTPFLSITIVHVTVIIATLWLGTKEGILIGGFWGLNSWFRALAMPSSPLQSLVLTSPIVSVLPRILMPLMIGMIFHRLSQKNQNSKLIQVAMGMLGALLNTAILLGFIGLFKTNSGMEALGVTTGGALWNVLGGIVVTNGVPEFIFAGLVTPPLLAALKHVRK